MLVLNSKYNIERIDFTDWMSFQPTNLIEEISLIQKHSAQIAKALNQHGIAEKTKLFKYECVDIANCIVYLFGNKYT